MKKGMSLEECVNKAREDISEQGMCYLAFDVVGSSNMDNGFFHKTILSLRDDLNKKFMKYFVGDIYKKKCAGVRGCFETYRADSAGTYISSPNAVKEIIEYTKENYSDFPLRWAVAKDPRDKEIRSL